MKKHKVQPKKLMLIVNPIAGKSRAKYNLASLASIFIRITTSLLFTLLLQTAGQRSL